jgi:hypothetical protein
MGLVGGRIEPLAVWGARGGHGATTIAVVLSLLLDRAYEGEPSWIIDGMLSGHSFTESAHRPIIDRGKLSPARDSTNLAVLRGPCLIGLRSLQDVADEIDHLVLIREPWRRVTNPEVESVLGIPVDVEVPFSERIAQLSDAGLLGARLGALVEFEALSSW